VSDERRNHLISMFRSLLTLVLLPLMLPACDPTLPPLRGQMEIGRDAYVVFVGGTGQGSDLYAGRPDGGQPTPITFTNVAERYPVLSPDGGAIGFLRGSSLRDSTPASVWVMNLLSGSERELTLPKGAGRPIQLGWEADGGSVVVRAEHGLYRLRTPPAASEPQPVSQRDSVKAESTLAVLLGDPVFARVVSCNGAADLCVQGDSGSGLLARGAHDPVRWGRDSVAFFVEDEVEIRPLGRGRPRRLVWSKAPERPREMTFFQGQGDR
jgi:hypothetical protein